MLAKRFINTLFFILLVSPTFLFCAVEQSPYSFCKNPFFWGCGQIREWVIDFAWLHRNLFSIDSAKICTACTPLYLITRYSDNPLQDNFYDPVLHKNMHQLPSCVVTGIEKTVSASVFAVASFSLFVPDMRLRTTSRLFAIGLISGLFLKDTLKKAKTNANIRPWHEKFSKTQRAHGGFPSGHMFEITCMTVVFGLEYGLKAWIPLSFVSTAMALASISSNRHYISQVVAGAALGTLYGVAAYKRLDVLMSDFFFTINADTRGNPSLMVTYLF